MTSNVSLRPVENQTLVLPAVEGERRRPGLTAVATVAADALSLALAWFFVSLVSVDHSLPSDFWLRTLAVIPVTIIVLAANGLYPALGIDFLPEAQRIVRCISLVQIGGILGLWVVHWAVDPGRMLGFWMLSMAALLLGRRILRAVAAHQSWWGESALLIGSGRALEDVLNLLARHPRLGLHVSGVLSEAGGVPDCASRLPILHDLNAGLLFAKREHIRTAIIALAGPGGASSFEAADRWGLHFRKLIVLPPKGRRFSLCTQTAAVGGSLGIEVSHRLLEPVSIGIKRCMDLLIAALALIALLPLMLVTALAIKLSSPGPIFFGHSRIGRGRAQFRAWKFRTMVSNADTLLAERLATSPALRAEWERDHKLRKDPRLTSIGALLRKYSLDELPQIWNVLRYEMSIVGPRPICAAEIPKYGEFFADYSRVLPGLTGLWQVSGRNETTYEQRVELDTFYVNNWSPSLDLYIIARTFTAVFGARGAY